MCPLMLSQNVLKMHLVLTLLHGHNPNHLEYINVRLQKQILLLGMCTYFFKEGERPVFILHGTVNVIRPPAGNNTVTALSLQ